MNFGNEDYNSFGGIPSSIIAYSGDRARYQTYDGIYDIQSTTNQQLTTLQDQVSSLQSIVNTLQRSLVTNLVAATPNLLVNGDCSQFTLNQPIIGTCNAGAFNEDYAIQGNCLPIFDRWYHVAELSGVNPSNFKMSCSQLLIENEIPFGTEFDRAPRIAKYGAYISWSSTSGDLILTPEHTAGAVTSKFGAMLGIQHLVPDVKQTLSKSYSLGFWIKSSYVGSGFIRVLRQYSTSKGGVNFNTGNALERILLTTFAFNTGWNYFTIDFTTNGTLNGNTIGDINGLLIQIGPFHYTWSNSTTYTLNGTIFSGSGGYGWVLTEMQLRSDGQKASKTNFVVDPKESQKTSEYICSVGGTTSTEAASLLCPVTYAYASINTSSLPTQKYTIDLQAIVQYPNKLKRPPGLVIWNAAKHASSPGLKPLVATYRVSDAGTNKASGSASAYIHNLFHNDAWSSFYFGIGPKFKLNVNTTANQNVTSTWVSTSSSYVNHNISYISEYSLNWRSTEEYTYTSTPESTLWIQDTKLWGTNNRKPKMVMIVLEADLGKGINHDYLNGVDYNYMAITAIPFP